MHRTLNHLLYMDDLKLYATNEEQLQKLIALTHFMSEDIGMLFGTKKCKILGMNEENGKNARLLFKCRKCYRKHGTRSS